MEPVPGRTNRTHKDELQFVAQHWFNSELQKSGGEVRGGGGARLGDAWRERLLPHTCRFQPPPDEGAKFSE